MGAPARLRGRSARAVLLTATLAFALVLPPTALASTTYELSIVGGSAADGSSVAGTFAGADSDAPVELVIVHNGAVVVSGTNFTTQTPAVGDLVQVQSPPGTTVAQITYDGLPTLDASVCAGSTSFSGQSTPNAPVSGSVYTSQGTGYGGSGTQQVAQVGTPSGGSFSGSFLSPITLGETVEANESLDIPLSGGDELFYYSENDRPVGACPSTTPAPTATPLATSPSPTTPVAPAPTPQQQVAASTTTTLPAPVAFKTVNSKPVSGTVRIKLPNGQFVPLTAGRQIPVGSIVDTTHGTISLTAAGVTAGARSTGEFSGGVFELLQNRKQKGIVDLKLINSLKRAKVCTSVGKGKPASAARTVAGKVLGLLHSNDNGHFSTEGDYSSATVRGTTYTITNTCAGTLTRVTRGVVVVDYVRRHETILLKSGQSFLALASGAKSGVVGVGKTKKG